jgi:D-aminopeptidase
VKAEHVLEAIGGASPGPVEEGCVGAGTGTICMGYKGGIGTSSRVVQAGGNTVGVLVQTNFGGTLRINGAPVGEVLQAAGNSTAGISHAPGIPDGSCMIVIATDAPLSSRNLERLAKRAFLALGRVGSYMSNGSGDYAIAFSTHPGCRILHHTSGRPETCPELSNDQMSPLFLAVVEATEEAIYNSLFTATDMQGKDGRKIRAIPIGETLEILERHQLRE